MGYLLEDDAGISVSYDEDNQIVILDFYDTDTLTRTSIELEVEDAGLLTDLLVDLLNRLNTGDDFDDDNN